MNVRRAVVGILCAGLLVGCAGVGPRALRQARFDYNEAVVRTFDEQMLLNLVRLRYRDTPYFLEVSSISTQYEFEGSAGATYESDPDDVFGMAAGVAFVERPTIVYAPLAGESFARRMLAPLSPESLLLLTGAGWRTDRVLRAGVVRINDTWNAPTASGPTPESPPVYEEFVEATRLLTRLSRRQDVKLGLDDAGGRRNVVLRFAPGAIGTPERDRLQELIGLPADVGEFRVNLGTENAARDMLTLVPRSLMGVLYYLSQAVEPPERDRRAGRVTITRHEDGTEFAWSAVLGDLLRVRSSLDEPDDAYVKVRYRKAWFWIDDADLSSKSTFNLLGQLFNLQAGEVRGEAPLLTLPLGP